MGINSEIIGNANDFSNFFKQGGLLGRITNAVIPLGNAIGMFHDTLFGPQFGLTPYFNTLTNWGTMLPVAAITAGAFLEGAPAVSLTVDRALR